MAMALLHLLPLWRLWILMVFMDRFSVNAVKDDCQKLAYDDIKLAAEMVMAAGNKETKNGDVLGTTLSEGDKSEIFTVESVITTAYQDKELKAVVAKNARSTVIAFRGTKGIPQLTQQLKSTIAEDRKELILGGESTRVMKFFWAAFETFLPKLRGYIMQSDWKYIIAGHSLGGAMASILAIYMKNNTAVTWNTDSILITFGQPRVGNDEYALTHDKMIPPSRKYRIVNARDPVPHVPIRKLMYKHHSREMWFSTDKTTTVKFIKICKEMDPDDCSNKVKIFANDHPMKLYKELVDSPPVVFRDKNGFGHNKFETAWRSSCSKA